MNDLYVKLSSRTNKYYKVNLKLLHMLDKSNYTAPEMEIMNIETEQCVLSSSIENIGNRNPDEGWN